MIKVNGGEGTGSGFIIPGGYIVTDNHVVTLDGQVTNSSLEVYFANGQSEPAAVVGRDPFSDIAIIKAVGSASMPALTLGNSAAVDVGDPVLAVGSPLGLADTVTSGIVSAVNRPVQPGAAAGSTSQVYFDAIQTDAPINPGNSGGPLVNARGQVIGVDAAIDTLGANPLMGTQGGSIGLGFAIPINQVRRVAVELIRTGRATHAVLGAVINTGWGGTGAMIAGARPGSPSTVTPGSPAALAGLRPGDVIIRFAGQPVTNGDTLLDAVRSLPPGQKVSVTFLRSGQTHTVSLRLGSAPVLSRSRPPRQIFRARGDSGQRRRRFRLLASSTGSCVLATWSPRCSSYPRSRSSCLASLRCSSSGPSVCPRWRRRPAACCGSCAGWPRAPRPSCRTACHRSSASSMSGTSTRATSSASTWSTN